MVRSFDKIPFNGLSDPSHTVDTSNANYVFAEAKRRSTHADPCHWRRLCLLSVTDYFGEVAKEEIINSGWLVTMLLFKNIYGPGADQTLSFRSWQFLVPLVFCCVTAMAYLSNLP